METMQMMQRSNATQHLFNFNNRVVFIERKLDSIADHLQFLEESIIEKHKAAMDQINEAEGKVGDFKAEIDEMRKQMDRITKRLNEFASKESLHVLEKYVSFFEPLRFVTEKEVNDLIDKKIKGGKR